MPRECISDPEKLVSHSSSYITLRTTTTFYRNPMGLAWLGVVAVTVDTEMDRQEFKVDSSQIFGKWFSYVRAII